MRIHTVVLAAQRVFEPVRILPAQIPLLALQQIALLKISLLDILIDALHTKTPFPQMVYPYYRQKRQKTQGFI